MVCINGSGRAYSWLRQLLTAGGGTQEASYANLNALAEAVPVGSDGLVVHPFGNGAERIFQNRTLGAQILGLDFNRHGPGHVIRATQEGIVFALSKGFEVLKSLSGSCQVVRAGKSNMFLSDLFATAFANTTGMVVELFNTDGSLGAARGAALGSGYYGSASEAFNSLERLGAVEPQPGLQARYRQVYEQWAERLPE
jgi:xylulokinase